MNGERYYTTKIWQRPSSIGFSSAGVLSISMDPRGGPVISTWKRPCQKIQNGSEFPELVAQIFRSFQKIFIRYKSVQSVGFPSQPHPVAPQAALLPNKI